MNQSYLNEIRKRPALERLAYWINEREQIRSKRLMKQPPPWTQDDILRVYRFCNVHREHDRVTQWIKKNWRDPNAKDPYLWHAMIIARLLNWPDTLAEIGYPEPWDRQGKHVEAHLISRQEAGEKIFTGAYIVSTNGIATDKVSYVLKTFSRAWSSDDPPDSKDTLQQAHAKLMAMHGMGSFMAAQVVADLKNTPFLKKASDWWTWCAPGPGSMRGLARLQSDLSTVDRVISRGIDKRTFVEQLLALRNRLRTHTNYADELCLQDLQNCLCEFDKYERVLWNQGKPRALYRSHS